MKKTALITGASRGIGAACARLLAKDGYELYLIYNKSEAEAKIVSAETGGALIQCDVSDSSRVKAMFGSIAAPDLLVCCAGIAHYGLFTEMKENEWRRVFDVNVGGVINCCLGAAPEMVRRKSGRIITISSIWGINGASCEAVYSASKSAVIGLTKSLAKELGPSGVLVNCVAPGVIETDMIADITNTERKVLEDETPLRRLGSVNDVASAVRFLASEDASFITGEVLTVSGGFSM